MESLTSGTFFNGRIRIKQNRKGYRFSIDAILLASLTIPRPGDVVVDLGTGCGIIPIILACRYPDMYVYGVEVQDDLAGIAKQNVKENNMEDRITIHCADMKTLTHHMVSGPVDVVVSNPPYRKAHSGRLNPNQQRAVARHEIKATLQDVVASAGGILRSSGRFIIIYPAERMTDLLSYLRSSRLEPKFLRMIHSYRQSVAKLVIVESRKGGLPGIKVGPPIIICDENGAYSKEVGNMFKC